MKNSLYLSAIGAAVATALCLGPSVASANNQHQQARVDTQQDITIHNSESGFHPFRGTANVFRSAANATAYGAREVGQTISGRQGRPSSEIHSAHERIRMRQYAADARQDFGGKHASLEHTRVETNSNLARHGSEGHVDVRTGGGPRADLRYENPRSVREYREHGAAEYRGNVGGGPNASVNENNVEPRKDMYRGQYSTHDNINGTREFREGGRSLVHGTGNAIRAAGNGVAYGVREAGQTISGRQGNPAGEAASARERARMHQEAGESRSNMHDLGTHTRNVGEDVTH